jgi:hypothetical protein
MATTRFELRTRRGWLAVAGLTLAVGALVSTQVHPTLAHADLTPAAATTPLSPTVASEAPATAVTADPTPSAEAVVPAIPVTNPVKAPTPTRKAAKPRAAAPTADVCSGPGWQAKRGSRALATLKDNGTRSGVSIAFKAAKPGYLGLTYPARRHVDVFVRSCSAESFTLLRHVMSHEMGHAYDAAHMTPALRTAYMKMRGIPAGTPWFGCSYCTDFATPAGDFAETYSQWQRGSSDSRTKIAPMPGQAQLAVIAAAFFQR